MHLTGRRQDILTGSIALLLLIGAVSVGVKAAFGAYDGGYEVVGTFSSAGQGLLPGSDVKINGVTVGEVRSIDLVERQARIVMTIRDGDQVPADSVARVRAKTLFGEKFIDIDVSGSDEVEGPFLAAGEEFAETQGGVELEVLLTDLYPVLAEIDPEELFTVLNTLAEGADGLGQNVQRTLINGAVLGEELAGNSDLTAKFLEDLALLSDELGDRADDVIDLAEAGNDVLPVVNENEAAVVEILRQTGRLSADVADLLRAHPGFVDAILDEGSDTVQLLFDERDQLVPLVVGLRQYVQALASVIRIDVGDGTLMAAVKGVLGGDLCDLVPCAGVPGSPPAAVEVPATAPPAPPPPAPDDLGGQLFRLLGEVLGG